MSTFNQSGSGKSTPRCLSQVFVCGERAQLIRCLCSYIPPFAEAYRPELTSYEIDQICELKVQDLRAFSPVCIGRAAASTSALQIATAYAEYVDVGQTCGALSISCLTMGYPQAKQLKEAIAALMNYCAQSREMQGLKAYFLCNYYYTEEIEWDYYVCQNYRWDVDRWAENGDQTLLALLFKAKEKTDALRGERTDNFRSLQDESVVIIDDGVREIPDDAFSGNTTLRKVVLPQGLHTIGKNAFKDCCALEEVVGGRIGVVHARAFCGCVALRAMPACSDRFTLGEAAFAGCKTLKEVDLRGVSEIGKSVFSGCTGLSSISFPSRLKSIGAHAFSGSGLKEVHLPDSVTKIEDYAFYGCSLVSLSLPENLQEIGESAFKECRSLAAIHIPASVKKIGKRAFEGCSGLKEVHLPDSMTRIEEYAFSGCSMAALHLPENLQEIGDYAFADCRSLAAIHIPASVRIIGKMAFSGCSAVDAISVDPANRTFDSRSNCNAVVLSSKHSLQQGCRNTVVPEGVTEIMRYAFSGQTNLKRMELPAGVTAWDYAFQGCTGLEELIAPKPKSQLAVHALDDCPNVTVKSVAPNPIDQDSASGSSPAEAKPQKSAAKTDPTQQSIEFPL